jgi:uncharacterized metal-binding protein
MNEKPQLSCANCTVGNCAKRDKKYPSFCLTENTEQSVIDDVTKKYFNSRTNKKIALTAAGIEGDYYGKLTRVEETLLFIQKMGYKKVGVATCIGLLNECNLFAKVAQAKGIELYGVACKVGSIDKTEIGIAEVQKIRPGNHEAMCNPILQAELLNQAKTEFNIIIGLCVGHDTLFIKHSKAPVTYLIVKDRVLCHNPASALYNTGSYYGRLLGPDLPAPVEKDN